MKTKELLRVEGLSKTFNGHYAVNQLNMTIGQGEIYGFLGPNGAGKTTTLKLILGLLNPTQGKIILNKQQVKGSSEIGKNIGAMIESPSFYNHLTGRRNLEIIAALYGGIAKDRVDTVLDLVEMREAADKKVSRYSLGMKQRLGIARAFLNDPKIILLDEPTNGLDPFGMKSVRELIVALAHTQNKTFLISTHLLNEVEQMCTTIGIIHNGTMVKELEMDQIKREKSPDISFEDYFISLTKGERKYV